MTWFRLGCLGALLALLGCGRVDERESGETHFVKCEVNQDCRALGGNYLCQNGECRSSTSAPEPEGPEPVEPPAPCESGCPGGSCAIQGGCSLQTTCELVGCSSVAIAEDGCYRPGCTTDRDCDANSRCTMTTRATRIDCVDDGPDSTCSCVNGKSVEDVLVCSPIELAGQRGEWHAIVVNIQEQLQSWILRASGLVTFEDAKNARGDLQQRVLSQDDLERLTRFAKGPDLRRLLATEGSCPTVEGGEVRMMIDLSEDLEISQEYVETVVTGCVVDGAAPGPLKDIFEIAKRY